MSTRHPLTRIMSLCLALVFLLLPACASLRIDVDVYKGPLANQEDVQFEQMAVIAMGMMPLLIQLRDKLENTYRGRLKEKAKSDKIPAISKICTADTETCFQYVGRHLEWCKGKYIPFTTTTNYASGKWFYSKEAQLVNEILSLYEDLGDSVAAAYTSKMIELYNNANKSFSLFKFNEESDEAFWNKFNNIILEYNPLAIDTSLYNAYKKFYSTSSFPRGLGGFFDVIQNVSEDDIKQFFNPKNDKKNYYGITLSQEDWQKYGQHYHTMLAPVRIPEDKLGFFPRIALLAQPEILGEKYSKDLARLHAWLLFGKSKEHAKEIDQFADNTQKILQYYIEFCDNTELLLLHTLDFLEYINTTPIKCKIIPDTLITGNTGRIELTREIANFVPKLIFVNSLCSLFKNDTTSTDMQKENFPLLWNIISEQKGLDTGNWQAGNHGMICDILDARNIHKSLQNGLINNPIALSRELKNAHRYYIKEKNTNDECGCSINNRYGIINYFAPIHSRHSNDIPSSDVLWNHIVGYVQEFIGALDCTYGLEKGRMKKGLSTLIQEYIDARYSLKQNKHDLISTYKKNLIAGLVHFAEKILLMAEYQFLIDVKPSHEIEEDTLEFLIGTPDEDTINCLKEYIMVLQATGNSILTLANELESSDAWKKTYPDKAKMEYTAAVSVWGMKKDEIFSSLIRIVYNYKHSNSGKDGETKKNIRDTTNDTLDELYSDTNIEAAIAILQWYQANWTPNQAGNSNRTVAAALLADMGQMLPESVGKIFTNAQMKAAVRLVSRAALSLPPAMDFSTVHHTASGQSKYLQDEISDDNDPRKIIDLQLSTLRQLHARTVHELGADSDEARKQLATIDALEEHRSGMVYIRPPSYYLRNASPISSVQTGDPHLGWSNMLDTQAARAIPFLYGWETKLKSMRSDLDKHFWHNINTVRVAGSFKTNYVIAKDDIGNWYVKTYSADPDEAFKSISNLVRFNIVPASSADQLQAIATSSSDSNSTLGDIKARYAEEFEQDMESTRVKAEGLLTQEAVKDAITKRWEEDKDLNGQDEALKQAKTALEEAAKELASPEDLKAEADTPENLDAALAKVALFQAKLDKSLAALELAPQAAASDTAKEGQTQNGTTVNDTPQPATTEADTAKLTKALRQGASDVASSAMFTVLEAWEKALDTYKTRVFSLGDILHAQEAQ